MSYPFSVLPCNLCRDLECRSDAPGHEFPVKIEIAYAGKRPTTAGGIFCHEDSPWNHAYVILKDGGKRFRPREKILHIATVAVKRITIFLANNPHESATGPSAIREICIEIQLGSFVTWWTRRNHMTPRIEDLLRSIAAQNLAFDLLKRHLSNIEEEEEEEEQKQEEAVGSFSLPIR